MMERHFDEELKDLNKELLKMAAMAEESIHRSIEALKNGDKFMAQEVITSDQKIDDMELQIEEKAIDLLAIRQPVAIDLRAITTAMKIITDLERIADLSVNIAQRVLDIVDQPLLKPLEDIPELTSIARKMVKDSIDAFVNHNEKLAKEVIFTDPKANELKKEIQEELIGYMVKDGKTATRAVPLLLVARHLERICDHATNIAEDVIYIVQAKFAKHRKIKK